MLRAWCVSAITVKEPTRIKGVTAAEAQEYTSAILTHIIEATPITVGISAGGV